MIRFCVFSHRYYYYPKYPAIGRTIWRRTPFHYKLISQGRYFAREDLKNAPIFLRCVTTLLLSRSFAKPKIVINLPKSPQIPSHCLHLIPINLAQRVRLFEVNDTDIILLFNPDVVLPRISPNNTYLVS